MNDLPQNAFNAYNADQPATKAVIHVEREFRRRLLADPYRPAFHFVFPEDDGRPGDPNGAFYANGRYHLMYLYNHADLGFVWGHASSKDLLHWRHHPYAIGPGEGDEGCFSGGAFVDQNDRAILSYWGLWAKRGICLAFSNDEHYERWTKSPANPVIQSTEMGLTETVDRDGKPLLYGASDPSQVWIKDGRYYLLTGNLQVLDQVGRAADAPPNQQGDRLYLFVSDDLENWEYLHPFYESRREWTDRSEDDMCPVSAVALQSRRRAPSGKHLLLFIAHNRGCQYYVGSYDMRDDRFLPESHGRMSWVDNAYFAPEALVDDKGRQIMWAWILDDRPEPLWRASGWNGMYGLPRTLWLGKDGTLGMAPVKELKALRQKQKTKLNLIVPAGQDVDLKEFGKELLELEITLAPGAATQCGVKVCCSDDGREETSLSYDAAERRLACDSTRSGLGFGRKTVEGGPFILAPAKPLMLRVLWTARLSRSTPTIARRWRVRSTPRWAVAELSCSPAAAT